MPLECNSDNLMAAIDSINSIDSYGQTLEYSQINSAVAAYLSEVSYDSSDYSYSLLQEYVIQTPYNKSKPSGISINLPQAGTLTLQDGGKCYTYSVKAGDNTVYNVTPNTTGSCIIKNDQDVIISTALLKPTGSLRMINCNTDNVRDLGGWSCDGGTVKYGMLFRGGEVNANDAALFHDLLGIRAELNLRWNDEVEHEYSLIGSDIDFKHINGPWCSIGTSSNWPEDAHKQILDYVIDHVIAGNPLYFHCAAGADRTGTVAFLLEALLGMSQSDTDKDYELTSFYSGISTDAQARRRDEAEWKNFMAQFNGCQGNTMRDKVVNWALSIGISIEKINAFRAAMIDGTPEVFTNSAGNVTVTRSLTGVSTDNTANSNAKYQPYTAVITPDSGKVITSVQVMMDGQDITDDVFSGNDSIFRHAVSYQLNNCFVLTSPKRKAVVEGECFCCELRADAGYSLNDGDNPTVNITMGGDNMAAYYKDGVINIPRVTGNLVISVSAADSAPSYTNMITESVEAIGSNTLFNATGYKNGYRYNSSKVEAAQSGMFITGFIHINPGDVIHFYGDIISGTGGSANSGIYKTDGTLDYDFTPLVFYNGTTNERFADVVYDSTAHSLKSFKWRKNYDVWMKFSLTGSFTEGTTIITINEEV